MTSAESYRTTVKTNLGNLHLPRSTTTSLPSGIHCEKQPLHKMHATVVTVPIRTAVFGARFSSAGLAPFAYAGTTSTSFGQQQQAPSSVATKLLQKRSASSFTTTKSRNNVVNNYSCSRLSCQRPVTLLLKSPSRSTQVPSSLVAVVQKSISGIRANSTTTPSASTNSRANAASSEDAPLDWNTFFQLRTSRRRYTLFSSILASIASTAIGVQILSTQDLDNLGAQVMGLDPFVVLGLATAAFGAVGWLAGPFLGNAIWSMVHRRYRRGVAIVSRHLLRSLISSPLGICY
jgi:import inner membrane translocase subunit TIM23